MPYTIGVYFHKLLVILILLLGLSGLGSNA